MPRCLNPRCQADYPAGSVQCSNPTCRCLLPEAVVAGRYRVETLIGLGGMGSVYRVSDTFEMEQVALKVLSSSTDMQDMPTGVERFRREARYAHQLRHKNIVPILNFGQDGALLYLVMPLVTGGTLKALLKAERPLPIQQAQRYLTDLADAIDAVHSHPQQIVHRDIKPSNLLIHQDDGRLVLADFGIARAMQQEQALTQRGWFLGTEHYVAPEQEQGQAEPASDIYSMGVVAYQMFTGLLPFQALLKRQSTEIPPPSMLNPALPTSVDEIILRAMDMDPTKRYSSGREFADLLNDAFALEIALSNAPTVMNTMVATSDANVIVHTIIPENPCGNCGRENRSSSRFCRHCGRSLDDASPLVMEVCQVGYMSDVGRRMLENEDMLLVVQGLSTNLEPPARPFSLFAVADGLLGPQNKATGGHEASRLAVETVADMILPLIATSTHSLSREALGTTPRATSTTNAPAPSRTDALIMQWLRDAVRQANQVIYHCNADYDTAMASTLTVALVHKRRLFLAGVGDSKAYRYSARQGLQPLLTGTHTQVDLAKGNGTGQSPQRSRYLGQQYHVTIDLFSQDVEAGDLMLLCTDGLWRMLRDEQIAKLLTQSEDPQLLARMLIDAANEAGGESNASVIVVAVQ